MILDLVARVFKTSHQAHLAHWATKSFSAHETLGDFYDDSISSLDTFVENYQAYFAQIGVVKLESFETAEDIFVVLKEDARWLNANRNKICGDIASLQNLFDNLVTVYTLAIYKLGNLK
jgi:DNA-binding ferritin-like protein